MSAVPDVNPYAPEIAEVVDRFEESPEIVTLRLRLRDPQAQAGYRFQPGQFNMLYLFGVGEVPISISSDPADVEFIDHTIRAVGRVTEGMVRLKPGDLLGLRGPYGRGWPVEEARGRDLLLITGGLGCAPTNSVIEYVLSRRDHYGRIAICHGVNRPEDLIYGDRFERWRTAPNAQVLLAAVKAGPAWRGRVGMVTTLLDEIDPEIFSGVTMMCGPEVMMRAVSEEILKRGALIEDIYVSMERNMQCALGHCGNCQYGREFLCKDGPVFPYERVRRLMHVKGY